MATLLEPLSAILADRLAASAAGRPAPFVFGLTGPQGSGKTTLARDMAARLEARGLHTVILALDDLYLPRAERMRLAAEVHPLFATRGVPGTHDTALGLSVIQALRAGAEVRLPRFDKAADDRAPISEWPPHVGPVDVILFEGWLLGAAAQGLRSLSTPVNDLERDEDPDGVWRTYANDQLNGPYRDLWDTIRLQALLVAPSFDVVLGWRLEQEHALIAERGAGMTDAEVARFVAHYQRLTGHIASELVARADLIARLGPSREVLSVDG